uniref:Uncharacterized protein n=1 Tax=Ditylenchus dipsaci TaxID=166011 RepID=A0A915CPA8_9BILA
MSSSKELTLIDVQKSLKNIGLHLREHQIEGVETILTWYEQNHGGILADEMGLGKTCQSIIALAMLASAGKSPALVICPLSVIDHWENEIARFSCGQLTTIRYYGSQEKREKLRRKELKKDQWNVLLTTFEVFLNDCHLLKFYWEFLVFDEAHRIKNAKSLMHQSISMSLPNIRCLLMMTGTPVQNNLEEFYSLLKLANPGEFPDGHVDRFLQKYERANMRTRKAEFRAMFQKYCLRRTKEILRDVPPASEVILYHGITRFQKSMYKALLRENRNFFIKNTNTPKSSMQSLMNTLVQVRKCVIHPYLFKGIEREPYVEGEHLVNNSGKMLILDRLLKHLYAKGHKVLIFSQMTRVLDIVSDYMELRGYITEMLHGATKSEDRLIAVENFQRPDSDVFCFLLTTKAGGIGLNLTAADTVNFIFPTIIWSVRLLVGDILDWDFNPQNDKQAAARCHRIGQPKPVKIIRLIAKHTVEEIIKYRAAHKLKLSELVLNEENDVSSATSDVFADLLLEGLKELEDEQAATMTATRAITDEQLEQIIGKTDADGKWEVTADEENNKDESEDEPELKPELFTTKALYNFEGKDYFEDRQSLNRFLLRKSENNQYDSGGDENLDEDLIDKILSSKEVTARRKPRKLLTDEEKEERKKQRKENELKRQQKSEVDKIRKRENLWEKHNYSSCNLELSLPHVATASEDNSEGCIYKVSGDITNPDRSPIDKEEHALIIHAVNDSDLHSGDSHLVQNVFEQQSVANKFGDMKEEMDAQGGVIKRTISVVLMVVQSARDRYRKTISREALEKSLSRIASYAVSKSARSVHLPMFWFGVQKIDEDIVRAMLMKHICKYDICAYIYRFARGANRITSKQIMRTQSKASPSTSVRPPPAKKPRMKDFADNEADYESSDEEEMESEEEDGDDSESNLSDFIDDEESGTSIASETDDEAEGYVQTAGTSTRKNKTGKRHH